MRHALERLNYEERASYDDVVCENLHALQRFVDGELRYLREAGSLASDYPSAADIIDETLVRALEDLPFRSEVTPVVSWLMGHASQVLRSEVGLARQRDHEGLTGTELLWIRRLHEAPYEDAIDEVERVDLGLDDLAV